MSDPSSAVVYSFGAMDLTDDAYYSDMMSDISSVSSGPSHRSRSHRRQEKQQVNGRSEEQRWIRLEGSHHGKENSSPDSDDPQSGNIFSFLRQGCGKVVLNKGTSLPSELEDLEGESCDCHCVACCSCYGNRVKQVCNGHHCACKKISDGAECLPNCNKEMHNLPSPTAIDSWGHFSKHKRNHYKYRRSDYSSDSDDENHVSKGPNSASNLTLLSKQKSHLPSITLTRQSSVSSTQSHDKSNAGLDVFLCKEGVKPLDFKERVKVCCILFKQNPDYIKGKPPSETFKTFKNL
jgi:hypothetical protein